MDNRKDPTGEPILRREATVRTKEGNTGADIVWTTGASVRRYSWMRDEMYDEILSMDPAHIRLGRINGANGVRAPLLKDHRASVDNVIGSVVPGSVKIAGGEGRAHVDFTNEETAQPAIRKIVEGHIGVSVGYRVHKFERTPPQKDGGIAIYRAVDWEPYEISGVAIGADAGAGFRADGDRANPCEIVDAVRAAEDAVPALDAHRRRLELL